LVVRVCAAYEKEMKKAANGGARATQKEKIVVPSTLISRGNGENEESDKKNRESERDFKGGKKMTVLTELPRRWDYERGE